MDHNQILAGFAELARDLDQVDREVYARWGKDATQPIIGEGNPRARIALFGRDPGADEVRLGLPFIGAGGQKIRQILYQCLHGQAMPDVTASIAAGTHVWWANTVPYKPIGNKAWSQAVKKRFFPLMSRLLLDYWQGSDVITVGREAFFWFGLGSDKQSRQELDNFWQREDRFSASLNWTLALPGTQRQLRLHPVPHPSPLNAVWHKRFPGLLESRLEALNFGKDSWLLDN